MKLNDILLLLERLPLPLSFSFAIIIKKCYLFFRDKKTLLTGPISSGKTTFLRYISEENIPKGASGSPRRYTVRNAIFDEVTDLSGDQAWLGGRFDEYIKEHDYILFFFDVSMYLENSKYRSDVNARIDMIYRTLLYLGPNDHISGIRRSTLLIGTHIDKLPNFRPSDLENMFADKPYQCLLEKIVYINTTQKECVNTILEELKK